jgi:uncharacterized protein (TIGR03067 family)
MLVKVVPPAVTILIYVAHAGSYTRAIAHLPCWSSAMRRHARLALGIVLLFAVTASLTATGDAKDEAIKKDRKKYQGTWQVVSLEVDGNQADEADAKKITVVNEVDGKWGIEVEGKVIARGTSKIDPTTKPKAVDLTVTEGESSGQTAQAIYEFGDDTRKVCLAPADKERPTEFASPAGSGHILAVLKRVQK